MTRDVAALVLAAHGERGGAGANARTYRLVAELAQEGGTAAVTAGFLKAEPRLEEAIRAACAKAPRVVVCPLLMADGYFAGETLRTAVRRAGLRRDVSLMPPIGCEPALQRLAHARARLLAAERGWSRPSVVVVGHGTPRDPRSRWTTEAAAARMAGDPGLAGVAVAFLEEEPSLAAALSAVGRPAMIVPYLWSAGRHGQDDLRGVAEAAGGDVALDRPVGEDRRVAQIVVNALSRMTYASQVAHVPPARGRAR